MVHYRGLTWEHPRGTNALRAAADAAATPGFSLHWDSHSLEGFESSSIEELAERYDLIVLDHPHLGDAAASHSLRPLTEVFGPEELAALSADSVGPSYRSYLFEEQLLALPLDAASQVSARRADLAGDAPNTWAEVLALSEQVPVALSLAGPHAFLTFCSLAVALGEEPRVDGAAPLVSRETGTRVLELMTRLTARAPAGSELVNPIGLLELMATSDTVAYCPLVYGYVNYAQPGSAAGRHPVSFGAAPAEFPGGRSGSTIGGTGIALSRHCEVTPALLDHLRYLVSADTQVSFIPQHDGQPASRAAWLDAGVNAASGNFYRETLATLDQSWVRPRFAGYTHCQGLASAVIRAAVTGASGSGHVLAAVDAIFADARAANLADSTMTPGGQH